MASAGKVGVDLSLAVKPKVGVGPSTVAGGSVTLAAYALALVAFFQGARDEATLSLVVVGTVSLVTTLIGRFAQATAAVRLAKPQASPSLPQPATTSTSGTLTGVTWTGSTSGTLTGVTWTGPTPGAAVTSTDVMRDNALDPDPPAGPDPSHANPALDDPDFPAVPTRAEHSGLKG